MEKCCICGKETKDTGIVWYSGDIERYLCRGCSISWGKDKINKSLQEKYKYAKPTTKQWHKMCADLQKRFDKWITEKKEVD